VIVLEAEPMTYVLGIVALLCALVLAWRGYRGAAQQHEERKKERDRRPDR
jgi:threonine/homoserine/homoserine lactone efflux protein